MSEARFTAPVWRLAGGRVLHRRRLGENGTPGDFALCETGGLWAGWLKASPDSREVCRRCEARAARTEEPKP